MLVSNRRKHGRQSRKLRTVLFSGIRLLSQVMPLQTAEVLVSLTTKKKRTKRIHSANEACNGTKEGGQYVCLITVAIILLT